MNLETIQRQTEVYCEGANNLDLLCEGAAQAVGHFGANVAKPFEEGRFPAGPISDSIQAGMDSYSARFPEQNNKVVLERTRKLSLPVVVQPEEVIRKTGFINIAVILYGILNIGLIVAMAIMK